MLDNAGPPHVRNISPPIVRMSEVDKSDNNSDSSVTVMLNSIDFMYKY